MEAKAHSLNAGLGTLAIAIGATVAPSAAAGTIHSPRPAVEISANFSRFFSRFDAQRVL